MNTNTTNPMLETVTGPFREKAEKLAKEIEELEKELEKKIKEREQPKKQTFQEKYDEYMKQLQPLLDKEERDEEFTNEEREEFNRLISITDKMEELLNMTKKGGRKNRRKSTKKTRKSTKKSKKAYKKRRSTKRNGNFNIMPAY